MDHYQAERGNGDGGRPQPGPTPLPSAADLGRFQAFSMGGAILNSALYLSGIFITGLWLHEAWLAVLALAASGITFLSYLANLSLGWRTTRPAQYACAALHVASILTGAAAGAALIAVLL